MFVKAIYIVVALAGTRSMIFGSLCTVVRL